MDSPGFRSVFFDANNDFDEIAEKYFEDSFDEVVIDIEGVNTSLPAKIVISYLIIHGAHHRAQLLNMLKRLEIPLPEIDVIDYYLSWPQKGTCYFISTLSLVMLSHCQDEKWDRHRGRLSAGD